MQVTAIKKGYDGVKVREIGETFEFDGPLGSWMVDANDVNAIAEAKSGKNAASTAKSSKGANK